MKKFLLLLALPSLLVLTGCATFRPGTHKNRLRINFVHDPPTLDPRKSGDAYSSNIQYMLYEGLTYFTPDSSQAVPGIAEHIDISTDKCTYTFYLKETHWSDGSEVTAYDFVDTWKEILSPNFPSPDVHLFYVIKNAEMVKKGKKGMEALGVKALDERTIEVRLSKPTPYFLELTAFPCYFPVKRETVEDNPQWAETVNKDFITNGPFRLVKWRHGHEYLLEKNPHYWNARCVQLDEIDISLVDCETTALQMFQNNELDILGSSLSELPFDSIPTFKETLEKHSIAASTFCFFNVREYPFTNENIRKAFMYATNRQQIVENITQLEESPATNILAPVLRRTIEAHFSDQNHQLASEHFKMGLEELGITKEQFPITTLNYFISGINRQLAQELQYQWKSVLGIDVRLDALNIKVFVSKLSKRDFEFTLCPAIAQYNDPMNILERFKRPANPKNYSGWKNARYSELLNKSTYASSDEERFNLLGEAEAILVDECPLFGIYHWNYSYLKQPNVQGLYVSHIGSIHFNYTHFDDEKN
ncbi:MAG: Oligopeptide-binding protein OppA [Chlamydiia bacterium]|nr:Oligopeptide-binding protein OppA [Chlamydiia bacterium]